MEIVVIGSAIIDNIIYSSRLLKIRSKHKDYLGIPYSSKLEAEKLEFDAGGSGHNVAVGLSKLGDKVGFIGRIGDDSNGSLILDNLKTEGVDVKFLKKTHDFMTGSSLIFITPDGEKTLLTYRGANNGLNPSDILEDYLKGIKLFVFTTVLGRNAIDAVKKTIGIVKRNGGKIVANPSINMIKNRKKELLQLIKDCNIVIMNKEEICELMGIKNERKALKKISELGIQSVVVTLGKKGLIAFDKGIIYRKKPFVIKIVDTTGAGDGFTAGFLHWIMKTNSFEDALTFGGATAALNIKSVGATKNLPSEKSILELIER